jgi:Amt family ammonium transporter
VGGLVTVWLKPVITRKYSQGKRFDLGDLCNGILVGCVGVTGACDRVENWAAFIIGVVSAFFYIAGSKYLEKFNIDDPVEATAVHAFGGCWGLLAVGIFDNTSGLIYVTD